MDARPLPLPFDAHALPQLSARLLESHHTHNYGGAVKRLNAIRAQLQSTTFASAPGFVLNGLKREELMATNSMLLHELYFGSLSGHGQAMEPPLQLALAVWAGELPADREVVVYCVYGHEVGRATAMRLRAAGLNARYLQGGIDGWQAAGRPLQAKGTAS